MAEKILIVDDDYESLRLIGLVLERRGYEIVAAQTGVQALAKAEAEQPDLVILDIMMPDIDGFEVCRRLRANPRTADLPVIMFTAKTLVGDKVAGFQAGADDYLTKPVHPAELLSRVEAVLLRSARRRPEVAPPAKARIVGFLGCKGGVGTSTLALNVAVALAQGPAAQGKVVLMDCQPGMATLSLQLRIHRQGGLARLLDWPVDELSTQVVENQLVEHASGVWLLQAPHGPPGAVPMIPPAYADAITYRLESAADFLLLDLGIGLSETNRKLLSRCHRVVVVLEPHRVALTLAQALLDELEEAGIAGHAVSLVLVRREPSAVTFTKDTIEGLLQRDLIAVIPPAPEVAFHAADQGVPIVTVQPESLIAQQFRRVAEYLAKE